MLARVSSVISWKGTTTLALLSNEITYIHAWMGWCSSVLPLRSARKTCANCLMVFTA